MNEVKKEDAATLDPQLRRRRRGIRVVQSAIVAIIAGLRGTAVLGLEHPATLSTNNLELVRGINGDGNLRDKSILYNVIIEQLAVILLQPGEIFRNELLYQWVLALCKVLDQSLEF